MKLSLFTLSLAVALSASTSLAASQSDLFVSEKGKLVSVGDLIADEVEVQSLYNFEDFCYSGNAQEVLSKLNAYKKTDLFYSGGGGGFEYLSGEVLHGIVTYDLKLEFKDEVAEGETQTVIVKPCDAPTGL